MILEPPKLDSKNQIFGGSFLMEKYSFELNMKIVQSYLKGEGGSVYLAKRRGIKSSLMITKCLLLNFNVTKTEALLASVLGSTFEAHYNAGCLCSYSEIFKFRLLRCNKSAIFFDFYCLLLTNNRHTSPRSYATFLLVSYVDLPPIYKALTKVYLTTYHTSTFIVPFNH